MIHFTISELYVLTEALERAIEDCEYELKAPSFADPDFRESIEAQVGEYQRLLIKISEHIGLSEK